jgi:TetR/AcrR family transcriptional regulator, cholesterol catabolism regulator
MTFTSEIKEISARKQEILDAAQQLFSEKGYVAASMRDLATSLGIRPASLYSHYKSKDQILWEIAIRAAQNFYSRVFPIFEAETSPEDKLDAMMQAHTQAMIANIDASAIFFTEWKRLEDEKRSQFAEIIATYEGKFITVLREGMEKGIFRPGDARFMTSMLLSTVNWMPGWYRPKGKMSPTDIAKASADFVLNGLRIRNSA